MIQTETIHPLPPAGYSRLSQGESQLLPTKWPHRKYIILPSLVANGVPGGLTECQSVLHEGSNPHCDARTGLGEGLEVSGER